MYRILVWYGLLVSINFFCQLGDIRHLHRGAVSNAPLGIPQAVLDLSLVCGSE
jgi:hypothetical protein